MAPNIGSAADAIA
eukprot:IDg19755t1